MYAYFLAFVLTPGMFLLSAYMAFRKKRGFWEGCGLTILLFPVFLVMGLLAFYGYTEANKAYWDYRVKQWCEKDGGMTVYEKVELTREEYERNDGKNGAIRVPSETASYAKDYSYLRRFNEKILNQKNPSVVRREYIIYRKSDGKYLGKSVYYSRSGGDFPTFSDYSVGFSCKKIPGVSFGIERKIFSIVKGDNR